jgi:hypothetical protein
VRGIVFDHQAMTISQAKSIRGAAPAIAPDQRMQASTAADFVSAKIE